MKVAVTPLGCAAALFALSAGVGRVQAQRPAEVRWSLEGNRGSYCIWYLADPDLARSLVPASIALAPAGTGAGLPPLLARTVQDEPRFAQWIPGAICIAAYDRVTSGGRTLAQGKAGRPVIVGTNSLAASEARGFPDGNELPDRLHDRPAVTVPGGRCRRIRHGRHHSAHQAAGWC